MEEEKDRELRKMRHRLQELKEKEEKYEKLYQQLSVYAREIHEGNQKRIKIGLRVFLLIPGVFLALLFLTGSNKIFFLLLWIISMFAISFYLITVEYADQKLQKKLLEWSDEEHQEIESLIGLDLNLGAVSDNLKEAGESLREAGGNLKQAIQERKQEAQDEKHS